MASVFTKIINGEIPSHKIYEDEHCYAFLDINPLREGHTLVVSKREVTQFFELPAEELAGLILGVQKIAKKINTVYEPKRVIEMAHSYGVEHVHIHLIPTNSYDEFKQAVIEHETSGESAEPDHGALSEVREKLELT